ncbi:MAG: pyridoxal phosphate-dependent aminotransferase [Carboxydocellales bacterium]
MRLAKRALQISPSPTLVIDAQAKKMISEGIDVLNFGVGEPDFDTPEYIKEAGIAAIKQGFTKYTPVAGTEELRKAIAQKIKKDSGLEYQLNEIVVSAGAKHSLYNVIQVLCDEGEEVILPAPYWVSYIEQIKLAGGIPKIIFTREDNGFKLTPEQLAAAITARTKILILNSPGNPTGAVYSQAELEALGKVIEEKKIYVIADEIYEKLLYDGLEHISIASLSVGLKELTVLINGVSKAYAMTGWRIGYTASESRIAKAMADLQSHSTSNASSIAQKASTAALIGSQQPLAEMLIQFEKRRNYMLERLQAMDGVTCTKPGGAFYLYPNVSSFFGKSHQGKPIKDSSDLADILLKQANIAVVPGIAFGTSANLRFSYATSLENIQEGMNRMGKVLREIC